MSPVSLKDNEILVLKGLQGQKKLPMEAKDLAANMNLDYPVLMTAVYELQNQGYATFTEQEVDEYQLTDEGKSYAQNGLPERKIIDHLLSKQIKECSLSELQKNLDLEQNLFFIGMEKVLDKSSWGLGMSEFIQTWSLLNPTVLTGW